MKNLLSCPRLLLIVFLLLCFASVSAGQDYKVGDKVKVMEAGVMVEVTLTGVDDTFLKYNIDRGGRSAEKRTPIGLVQSWNGMADEGGDYSVDSRTHVGFQTTNGVTRFPTRTWVKNTGEEFRARLKTFDSSTFVLPLVKEDGTELEIDLGELDEIDNTYMNKLAAQINRAADRSAGGGRGSRFDRRGGNRGIRGGRDMTRGSERFGTASGSAAAKYKTTKLNTESVKEFKVSPDFSPSVPEWQPKNIRSASIPFDFAGSGSVLHVSISEPILSRDGGYAAIGIHDGLVGQSKIVVFDLARNRIHAQHSVASSSVTPIAFSPDNSTLVTAHSFGIDHRIFFWALDPNVQKLEFKKAWEADSTVNMGAYLDADRLVMATALQVVVFEPKTNRAVSATAGSGMSSVAGGGGYTVNKSNDGNFVIDFANQTRTKFSDFQQNYFGNQAINANGRLFATFRSGVTNVFDLTNGKRLLELAGFQGVGSPKFVGSRFLIVGNHLYDMRLQAAVAEFQTTSQNNFQPVATNDGVLLYTFQPDRKEKRYVFVVSKLMTPELGEKISTYTSGEPVKIGAGTNISINTRMKNQKIPGDLKTYLTDAGLRVTANAKIVVEAEVEQLQQVTVDSGEAGKVNRQVTTISYTPTISHLRLKVDGETILSKQQENNPGAIIRRNQNESVQAAARRMCNPNPKFFTAGAIPTKLNLYPGAMPVIGVTESGLVIK